tara:strand:- start:293 stop:517 length:225 start_codon:yes stop_codon:yes gene_type:complete
VRLITIIFFLATIIIFNSQTLAQTEKDCEKYNKNTILGSYDYRRCIEGKNERKKLEIGNKIKSGLNKINIFKKN